MFRLFDLSLRLNGFPIKEAKQAFAKIVARPEKGYTQYLENKRNEIVQFHFKHNAFYRQLAGSSEFSSWEDLPVVTKSDFQKPLTERLSDGFTPKNVYINRTSGSSGDPFIFAKDKFCHALIWASAFYRFGWHGIDFNTSFQARFYGYPVNFTDALKLKIKDYFANRYRLPLLDLSEPSLDNFIRIFSRKKINYINGYTSSLVIFAKHLKKRNLILQSVCPGLKVCVVTSEMLFEDDKKLLESQFGVPVVNEYGASELDIIAFQNKENQWMLNTQSLYIEVLDDNNLPVADGEQGNLVITSLYNKAHPFIRYKIGDWGSIQKLNEKDWILKELVGRTNDIIQLPSGKIVPGMAFYVITKKVLDQDTSLKEFVVTQKKIDVFEIDYVSSEPLSENRKKVLSSLFADYLEPNLFFIFNQKEKLQRTKAGKLKQFTSEL
ncbi:phenylacetate--CoA ligase family protein [Flavobacterium sp. SM15]|uniref:phenylacetate--CoA ligase family protein n=1 Tax=Flavobacterium sp. SM15 TaxID=2908005 RepID=UPI001EDA065F|nr:phenylacetate--CoA ligase family protein [Flavobacterium sp. SM15]